MSKENGHNPQPEGNSGQSRLLINLAAIIVAVHGAYDGINYWEAGDHTKAELDALTSVIALSAIVLMKLLKQEN